jgi:hypothetical protein
MAKNYIKVGNGTAFKNDKKGNDKAPDYTGPITVINKDKSERPLRVSIWHAETGKDYEYSIQIQEVEEQPDAPF